MNKSAILYTTICILFISFLPGCSGAGFREPDHGKINAEGLPIVNDSIDITMWGVQSGRIPDMGSNIAFKRMEQLTNIKIDFTVETSINSAEKLAHLLSSDDVPDVLCCSGLTYLDEIKYGGDGTIIPLNELIDEYAPNIKRVFEMNPDVRKSITSPDGNIYSLPRVIDSYNNHLVINAKWLDKLGLEMPNDLDSFYRMLQAFKYGDPNGNGINDEIPLSGGGMSLFNSFLANWGILYSDNGMYVYPGESEVKYANIQPGTKDALIYFRKLYSEGLLDPEAFTQDNTLLRDKGTSGRLGVFQTFGAFTTVGYDQHFCYESFEPFKDINGNQFVNNSSSVTRGRLAITSKCKYPEAVMRWADYLFSLDGCIISWMGVENESFQWIGPDKWDWIIPDGIKVTDFRTDNTIYYITPGTNIDYWDANLWHQQNDDIEASINSMRAVAGKYGVDPYPSVFFSSEDFNKIVISMGAIQNYVNQSLVNFIIGETDIEENWDKYVLTVKSMGIQNIIDIYQSYYDEWITK